MSARLPSAAGLFSTMPRTPFPVTLSKLATSAVAMPRASAPLTIAAPADARCRARGWRRAQHVSSSVNRGRLRPSRDAAFPSVSVPVLSTTSVSTLRSTSIASAFRNRTPIVAPFPVATMIDIGVARPSAHGHAMISTATALTSACAIRGSGPTNAQTTNVTIAAAITAGTK